MNAECGVRNAEVKSPATLRADVLKQPRLSNFRRLLNTRWQGVTWRLVVNHGAKATGETLEELVPGVFSLNSQLFAIDDVTDIHFCGDEVVVAVERKEGRA
ncbi:MAG: hypothetical protein EBS68_17315 [Rhodobacteraceae bacterium]|nr:hypothetical protein [Paracoccaceae bacterium]